MSGRKVFYLIVAVIVLTIGWLGWKTTSRSSYESVEYRVLESDGPFEVREYPDLMLVTTPMEIQSQGNDGSFGRLFQYISGENDDGRKVAMTTPVFMEEVGGNSRGQMGFVIPKDVADSGTPNPTRENVQLRKRAGGQFAVLRFAGRINQDSRVEMEKKLRLWMESKNLAGETVGEFAGYDPPWTPGPFRRNEILVRLN